MNGHKISITSPAFKDMGQLPVKYTRDGDGIIPGLRFENIPESAKSLVLIMDDPDAPYGTFDHWLLFNISPKTKEIKEGSAPADAMRGKNSGVTLSYISPSPPPGKAHRYVFKLYALDSLLSLKEGADKTQIEKAMAGHIISQASLTGLYKR
jgi:Raf kinase inhibitor-like YbhB/YbcL family protein